MRPRPMNSDPEEEPAMTTPVIHDVPKQLFIAGTWRDAESGRTLPVDDPATGAELCRVADAAPADARPQRDPPPRLRDHHLPHE
jgi:hypothetical protein